MCMFPTNRADKAIIVYEFAMSHAGSVIEKFFDSFFIQSDGFSGYNKLGKSESVTRAGCIDHERHKFVAIVNITKQTGAAHYPVAIILNYTK
jgi:transposase